jgi:TM2 domain-containing membrane protein YozV
MIMGPQKRSEKSRLACFLLCFFIGWLGAHRFYTGKTGTAILMILTIGGGGIWVIVDLIFILTGAFRDKAGDPVLNWTEKSA